MSSRLSKVVKTEDLNIRYKDCDLSGKALSSEETPVKSVKAIPSTLRIFKTTWGDVSLN
jgi:hypothetical protein